VPLMFTVLPSALEGLLVQASTVAFCDEIVFGLSSGWNAGGHSLRSDSPSTMVRSRPSSYV